MFQSFQLIYAFPTHWSGFKTPFSFSIRLLAAHGLLLHAIAVLLALAQCHKFGSNSYVPSFVPTTACPAYSNCGYCGSQLQYILQLWQLNKLTTFSPAIDPKFAHVGTSLSHHVHMLHGQETLDLEWSCP